MDENPTAIWRKRQARRLADALAAITDVRTMRAVLRDVMTESEIDEVSTRLEAARMLDQGLTYVDVVHRTRLSSRTVARISDWMQHGCNGYAAALALLKAHHTHA